MPVQHAAWAWSVAILTLIAYFAAGMFVSQGFTPSTYMSERAFGTVTVALPAASGLACLLALFAMHREGAPERPALIRLPKSRPAKWALGSTVVFYLAVVSFTGNTLFDLVMPLGLSDETLRAVFPAAERLGLWSIVASAVGAFVMALVALTKDKDRALVLGLPLLPAPLMLAFIVGELLGHG
jgi:hypothetical protein